MKSFILLGLSFPFLLFSKESLKYTYLQVPNSSFLGFMIKPQSIHIIEVDPLLYEIRPVKALDNGIGRESVLSLNNRYGASASVNGGFFAIEEKFEGQARGALKIHDWYALPWKARGCIGWSSKNEAPQIDRLLVSLQMHYDQITIPVDGLNRCRKQGEIILFTPCFHKTTLTDPDGEEVIVNHGVIQSIVKGGSSKIPESGYVLSLQATHPLFETFKVGMPISCSTKITPQISNDPSNPWDRVDYIVGGSPLLLYNGSKLSDFKVEETTSTFLTNKHARTAIGILPNGNWVFIVVDKTSVFDGMTIDELSDFLKNLGCLHALNLDGGGSSTMVYEGSIKNTPYGDRDEARGKQTSRLVSDAILILPQKIK